ncbi:MAG: hypothetical protein K2L68_02355, partial [Muribaculaceae bacterium]|nr:hypothetical protein [Muribaculaceae bacterium]
MTSKTKTNGIGLEKRRKLTEWAATFGLLLICAALVAPFSNPENPELPWIFKWIYSGGALIYT